jgi:filamentous hemagglutinin
LADLGYNVVHLPTASSQGYPNVRSPDLGVGDVGKVDVYTPTSANPNAIVRGIEAKKSQASSVLVLSKLTDAEMDSIAARTWGKPNMKNFQTLFFQNQSGTIVRIDRPNGGR